MCENWEYCVSNRQESNFRGVSNAAHCTQNSEFGGLHDAANVDRRGWIRRLHLPGPVVRKIFSGKAGCQIGGTISKPVGPGLPLPQSLQRCHPGQLHGSDGGNSPVNEWVFR